MGQIDGASSGGLIPFDTPPADFPATGPFHGDFTYRFIKKLTLSDRSLARSLWNGAVLQDCTFTRVDFSRSDFAGTQFISCTFIDCNLEPDELRSCFLSNCTFQDCSLVGLQCVSTQFVECHILDCDLSRCVIRESRLADCTIKNTVWPRSSITLNQFANCRFENQAFGDTTVFFVVFDDCTFDDCAMTAESAGFTFGLTAQDAGNMKWVYLGEDQDELDTDIVSALIESYRARRWYLGLAVLELNFAREPAFLALSNYADALHHDVSSAPRIDLDELTFMTTVLEQIAARKSLPFYGLWRAAAAIEGAIQRVADTTPGFLDFSPASTAILARLRKLMKERISELAEKVDSSLFEDRVSLRLTMKARPQASLPGLVPDQILTDFGATDGDFHKVDEFPGSWIEIWQLGLAGIGAIHLTLATIDTTWEHLSNISDKAKKSAQAIKRSKQKVKKGTELEAPSGASLQPMDLRTVAAAVERASRELRPITDLDRQAVAKLDLAVQRLAAMSNNQLSALAEYARPNLESISLEQSETP